MNVEESLRRIRTAEPFLKFTALDSLIKLVKHVYEVYTPPAIA
jgi:hypothetical protein